MPVGLRLVTYLSAGLAAAVMTLPAMAQGAAPAAAAAKAPAKVKAPVAAKAAAPAPDPAAPVAKPKKPAPKILNVLVINQRDATLVDLSILGRVKNARTVLIASGVGPGGKKAAKVPANQSCLFSVSGSFDDESTVDVPTVNLCKDPRITLVE